MFAYFISWIFFYPSFYQTITPPPSTTNSLCIIVTKAELIALISALLDFSRNLSFLSPYQKYLSAYITPRLLVVSKLDWQLEYAKPYHTASDSVGLGRAHEYLFL